MEWLAATGDDGVSGARGLRRAVEQEVEAALSPRLLRMEFAPGSTVVIDANEDGLVFSNAKSPTPETDVNPAPNRDKHEGEFEAHVIKGRRARETSRADQKA